MVAPLRQHYYDYMHTGTMCILKGQIKIYEDMKKWVVYLLGVLTGIILMFALAFILYVINSPVSNDTELVEVENEENGVTMFKEPGEIIEDRNFEVFQVIAKNAALVRGKSDDSDLYLGTIYLMMNEEEKYYYDDERIKVPKEKVVRQMGIYQYPTKNDIIKTVPIICIMDN